FVLVVPVLADGRLRVQRAYRHGARRICLGFPGGFIDPGEAPATAALRELAEETGLIAADLHPLGALFDNGNQRGCHGHYFVATGCRDGAPRQDDPQERAEDLTLSAAEIDRAMAEGGFAIAHHVA
ncbi:NUDIX hydrolase, partial [Arthrospira platensis SPKY1]|nr:NUDIX hydrolase [Arthrospira platensis SPKY1]